MIKKLILLLMLSSIFFSAPASAQHTPQEIINRLNENLIKIKDAKAEITLDTSLQILGCSGVNRQRGYGWFKAPDKIKVILDRDTYLIKGNFIRWIDAKGRPYRIQLLHAPDFSCGFNANIIPHNFNLKIIKDDAEEIVIEGLPKPGVLKNVKKIFFYIDPKEYLLRRMNMSFKYLGLAGRALIKYEKINGLWAPVATSGISALEICSGSLAGFKFNLEGKNFKINTGISNEEFERK